MHGKFPISLFHSPYIFEAESALFWHRNTLHFQMYFTLTDTRGDWEIHGLS